MNEYDFELGRKKLKEFREQYYKDHKACPECGYTGTCSTYVGYIPIIKDNGEISYKDENRVTCNKCHWQGITHDLVKETEMGDIVLVLGYNAAGKSTYTESYVAKGYTRLNRDELGGKLDSLPLLLADFHKKGHTKFVLDNTYADIESRKSIIECGKKLGLPVNCMWLDTSFEDAQFNACQRMIRKVGHLMSPDEMKKTKDPNLFPPVALFNYKKRFQKPTTAEGFSTVNRIAFVRKKDPKYCNKALILDYDDTLRRSKGEHPFPVKPEDVEIIPGRVEKIKEYQKKGYQLFGVSNQSGIAKGTLTQAQAIACFEKTNELLGLHIDYVFCSHSVPPVNCYCRKPSSGHGVWLIEEHLLDREQCIFVGDLTSDKTFAQRCGFKYYHPEEFFNG